MILKWFLKFAPIFLSLFLVKDNFTLSEGLISKNWESHIKNSIQSLEYQFQKKANDTYQATNRKRNLRASIFQNNFELTSRTSSNDNWKIQYQLKQISKDHKNYSISNLKPEHKKNKLKIKNNEVDIVYQNSDSGIRQDFIVHKKIESDGLLKVKIEISTPFKLIASKEKLVHVKNGKSFVSYENLNVFDANQIKLPAHFELEKNTLAIVVDDRNAKYPITIDPLSTTPNWSTEQNQADASFGYAIAFAGDVNYDGYGDVIVGAPNYDNGFTDEGAVFLYYGSSTGLNSTPAWSYTCKKTNCQLGYSLDRGGKLNNDNYGDFIVGAPYYTNGQNAEGAVMVFHGTATTPATTPNRILEPNIAGIHFGMAVSGNAKFNNDTYNDIAVGAPHYVGTISNQGAVYVFWGSTSGVATTIRNTLTPGVINAEFGQSLKVLGDVNADGYSDLVVSAPSLSNGNTDEGKAFLYLGSASGLSNTVTWTGEINIDNANYGETIQGADINHDGKTDLVVGAPKYSGAYNYQGAVFVYYSNGTSFGNSPDVSFYGTHEWEYFGGGLFCGDVNGDSFAEIIIGSTYFTGTYADEGKVYIYYGTAYGIETTPRWTKTGGSVEASFGQSITVGDINGDATPDLITSAVYESNGQSYEGKVYSFFGSQRGLSTVYSQRFNVSQASSQFAFAIDAAGDVNGDGYDDLIVGAYNYDNGQTNEGAAFLFYGTASGLNTTPAWTYENNQASSTLGYAVTGNCDVNGDGYKDVLVGANQFDNGQTNEGRVYAFYGSSTGLAATANWTAESNLASAQFGKAIHCNGDYNNDGYSDVLIGAPSFKTTYNNEGKAYLYKGSAAGILATPTWTFVANQLTAYAGSALSFIKDINGDGYDEIMIGAYTYDNTLTDEGAVFLFYGNGTTPSTTPNWTKYGEVASAQLGYSLSYAKKLNNDNYGDFIIGAPGYKSTLTAEGAAFIYYGSASGPQATPLVAVGGQTSANFGKEVSSVGDVDGDGFNDVSISASLYDNGQTNEGSVYIYLGSSAGVSITSSWKAEGNLASAQFGLSVAGDFDINGDGYDDIVVGAPAYKITNTSDGALFTFLGSGN